MKLNFIILFGALLIAGSVNAQGVNIGIKGGLNVYNINNDSDNETDPRLGLHVGLLGHIHLADQFALQPEITYSMQGAKDNIAGVDVDFNLDYINVPLLFQYMFDNGFRIQAGPQVGFLIAAKANDTDKKSDYNTLDLGLGLGVSYVHPSTGFGIDARYNHGLSNINDGDAFNGGDAFNRGLQFGVFYLFKHRD